jgi:hypothetical protein
MKSAKGRPITVRDAVVNWSSRECIAGKHPLRVFENGRVPKPRRLEVAAPRPFEIELGIHVDGF